MAASELLTRRQLAAEGLRPGRCGPVALLVWGRRDRRTGQPRRWAALHPVDQAREIGPCTPARRRGLDAAMAARRTCRTCRLCGPVDHCVRSGLCARCFEVAGPTSPTR